MRNIEHTAAGAARTTAPAKPDFFPHCTIKCEGRPTFRSQAARDVGCLLDVDRTVASWECQPVKETTAEQGTPDFLVIFDDGSRRYLDAPDRMASETSFFGDLEHEYRQLSLEEVYGGPRLENARDLLRYGRWRVSLSDRVRLLAALDEHGTLTVAECMGAFQETKAMAGIASLILFGFVEVDLDRALIGPETIVRRIRR